MNTAIAERIGSASHPVLSDKEFEQFRQFIYEFAGISLSASKKLLVGGRLAKRLQLHGLNSYGDYYRLLHAGAHPGEMQIAVDLLTTNETYFFREPKHFEFMRGQILANYRPGRPFRVWSAACSSGQEPYSIAMMLAERLGDNAWEIVASDLSTRVLERARGGLYAIEQAEKIPQSYLKAFCLKGTGTQTGSLLMDKQLRSRINFMQVNLNATLPNLGEFDLIFLRNVMIYFDTKTKQQVVERIAQRLRPGGHLFIGHSESLSGVFDSLKQVSPAIYRKA